MLIRNLIVNENSVFGYSSNCYLLISNGEAAVVDPSIETHIILNAAEVSEVKIKYILLTHGHFDHMHTLDELRTLTGAEVCIHEDDAVTLSDPAMSLFTYFGYPETVYLPADKLLSDGDKLTVGNDEITVVHTPGHTPGCVCYVCDNGIITGDTIFDMSIGRYDFPRSNGVALMKSIKELYKRFPDERIFPGHGNSSTMRRQINENPWTRGFIEH